VKCILSEKDRKLVTENLDVDDVEEEQVSAAVASAAAAACCCFVLLLLLLLVWHHHARCSAITHRSHVASAGDDVQCHSLWLEVR